ncbi:metallophosphoesterase [Paramuribaculum intestinale]|uniref:Metallophosphoesterase n=8 Tax=Paramuribaculum intestinale TaxID=2094151 RepID=A0A2V1IR92_9BACT|nr:metallophosphoesterase [Paramuribaculum intestinale]PWB07051.1 metallophosphoesterase [Paramuribaculum intestinale]PWB10131.1 metallophosphoesterase [Paramuribaculum intestinale]ROS93997.1 metallophosphoesterase [Muribaculaceae bacterium Isolate-043 (Harlan)]WLT43165.1 metallophosphoesterase [Paramuribaculum intestinale]
MRIPLLFLITVIVLSLLVDGYIYIMVRRRCVSKVPARLQLVSAVLLYMALIVGVSMPRRSGDDGSLLFIMWVLFGYMTFIMPKLVFVVVDAVALLPVLWHGRRWRWLSLTGGVIAIVAFLAMWWGALVNRFRVDVREVDFEFPHLPAAFDGFKIVQISDLHVGTYGDDDRFVRKLVGVINGLHPDAVMFTGDIVNRHSSELIPFVDALSGIEAPYGVFSILGNHDYGDYADWPSEADKAADVAALCAMQESMGWKLLLNQTEFIHSGRDSIAVIGVENIGDPPFRIYGSLPKAYPGVGDSVSKILLSHNPAHWTDSISDHDDVNIALTLSGHTHAMQIEVAGLSPAAMRYATWGGMYGDEAGRHALYVNIGAGTVGMPMRLGATPEITLITLKAMP